MGKESIDMILEEPYPAKAALAGFLERLPDYVVFSIMALMYSGRDNVKDVNDYWSNELREKFPNVEVAINSIREKNSELNISTKVLKISGKINLRVS